MNNFRFQWTPEKILWQGRASQWEENDRNRNLSQAILEELPKKPRILDMGCGLGYLDRELAKASQQVYGIDLNPLAIDHLKQIIERESIENLSTKVEDFCQLTKAEPFYDGVVQCLIGHEDVFLKEGKNQTDNKIFSIARADDKRGFSSRDGERPHRFDEKIRNKLIEEKLDFFEKHVEGKLGQPFIDFDEAVRFMQSYDTISTLEEIERALESRLKDTESKEYPLFLPSTRKYTVFVISLK